jgi:hypothetical protein
MKMLQLFVLAAFFATVAEATTALQTFCASGGIISIYNGTSCYVVNQNGCRYSVAKNSCQDILGYYGHLVFMKNSVVKSIVQALLQVSFLLIFTLRGTEAYRLNAKPHSVRSRKIRGRFFRANVETPSAQCDNLNSSCNLISPTGSNSDNSM